MKNQNASEYEYIRMRERMSRMFYGWRDGGEAMSPHTLCLAVNNVCFMKCRMCDVGQQAAEKTPESGEAFFYKRNRGKAALEEIPQERLREIVDEIACFEPTIKANFLEPLLRKDLFDFARYVKSKGLRFYYITNGWLLEKYAAETVDAGVDLVRISLDGARETHDRIRGKKGSFDRVIGGLHALVGESKKSKSKGPLVGVCFTIFDENQGDLLAVMDELKKEKLLPRVYVNFNYVQFFTAAEAARTAAENKLFLNLTPSGIPEEHIEKTSPAALISQIRAIRKKYPADKYHYYFTPNMSERDIRSYFVKDSRMYAGNPCRLPWYTAQVLYNGDVVVYGRCICRPFGNIYEKSFMDIWNGPEARRFRSELRRAGSFTACNRCIGTLYPVGGRD